MGEELNKISSCYIPKRYILIFFGFFGMFNLYAIRVSLSLAMVAMTNSTEDNTTRNLTTEKETCAMLERRGYLTSKAQYAGEQYNWDARTKGVLLGAFYYGYVITQIPAGYFTERFGSKWLFGGGILVTSLLSLATPISARLGVSVMMFVCILRGFSEGVTLPAMNCIVSQWSPIFERSRMMTFFYMGNQVGSVVSMLVSGWLSSSEYFGGWPSAFYLFGSLGIIWFLFWTFLISESPFVHPTISDKELALFQPISDNVSRKKPVLPWKSILRSIPVWATIVSHIGHGFGYLMYLTELPEYLSSVLHFDIEQTGALSSLPFLTQAVVAILVSFLADKLRSSNKLSITWIRKVMNTIGMIGPAVCLLCITISGCRAELIIFLLTLGFALNGFTCSGFCVTYVDLSPDFAGILFGISNTFANLSGVIVPALVGTIMTYGVTFANWNKVFYVTSALYIGSAVFYFIFASAEEQPWGKDLEKKKEIASSQT